MSAAYTLLPELQTPISAEEQAFRVEAVSHAAGNLRAEGMAASPFMKALEERYIKGELSHEEVRAQLHRRYNNNAD